MSDRQTFVPYGQQFEEALLYAARVHGCQHRKGTTIPYITHLLGVAAIVGENGGTETEVIAALLHDAVEDQGGAPRLRDIWERFGGEVGAIVRACSDTDQLPKPPWRERKEAYVHHLAHGSSAARLVSAADKPARAPSWPTIALTATRCGAGSTPAARATRCGTTANWSGRSGPPGRIPWSRNWTAWSVSSKAWWPRDTTGPVVVTEREVRPAGLSPCGRSRRGIAQR